MSATILEAPYYYSFSKNQLRWKFYITSPTAAGCKLQFKLMADSATDIAAVQRIFETELRPDSDGFLNVSVQDIVDSMIEYSVPNSDDSNIVAGENIKFITIQYRRISDDDLDPEWIIDADPVYVIKGGIELLKADYNNYFYNYHGPNKVFATWQPKNRFVSITDDWWMSILFANADLGSPDLSPRKLQTKLEWSDGTSDTVEDTVPDIGPVYLLYHANVGKIVKAGIVAHGADKQLWRITVKVVAVDDEAILYSEAYTVYADYRQFYDYNIFNFYNSVGGIDHVRVLADSEDTYSRGFIEADMFVASSDVGSPSDHQYFQANFTRLNTKKSDTGYRHTKAEILAYQELLTSGLIFEIFNNSNGYRMIGLLNKGTKLFNTGAKRFGFAIEWRYSFVEQVYTPDINLGVGFLPCVPVTLMGSPELPDAGFDTPYSYSISLSGSLPYGLVITAKPEWMFIVISGFNLIFSGTPDGIESDVEVTFDVTNCSGDSAHLSNLIDVIDPPPTFYAISSVTTGGGTTTTQVFEVGPNVNSGDTFQLQVYSHIVSVVAGSSDTPTIIATAMASAVNGTSEGSWNSAFSAPAHGTPGFKPVATSSGAQVTVIVNFANSFISTAF